MLAQAQSVLSSSNAKEKLDPKLVAHGKYLVTSILSCGNCHAGSPGHWGDPNDPLSGGRHYATKSYKVTAGNLTPDPTTGLPGWTPEDFARVLSEGVRPDGLPVAQSMPWVFFRALTKQDLKAVSEYLVTLRPVYHKVPAPVYLSPAAFQPEYSPGADDPFTQAEVNGSLLARGRYLATVGHCLDCHTPMVKGEVDYAHEAGKGGRVLGQEKVVSPNITSDPTHGLGRWTNVQIKRAITQGISRDGHRLTYPMPWRYFAHLKPQDVDALVAWLRTLPPKK